MATANTTIEIAPTMCEGRICVDGNPKPVTLVAIVLTRNTAVAPSRRFDAHQPL
jgi:hypothetical protein